MRMTKRATITGAALVLALACAPAMAQIAQNSDAPVDVTADELEVINASCQANWKGSAEALQDTARLRADVLKIYYKPGAPQKGTTGPSCGPVDRMEALGNVYYVTPQQKVHGDNATYEATSDTITITGDVVAVQGANVLRGQTLVIRVKDGQAQMLAPAKGRNKPGRVRGVFYPNQQQAAGSPAPRR
jgi:lipopolysaccharide export system protein LptA